ncbi:MAG TPA: GNAT family N-acetyltransferase [Anaerolineae bacterium]|nr:GNAT family N-acetyltransferase [Anaerolineae bacterium]
MNDANRAEFVPATLDDLPTLRSMMSGVYIYDGEMPDVDRWAAAAMELIQHPDLGRIWMIHLDGQAIGYLAAIYGFSLEFYGRGIVIDELFVDEAYRSQGIGRQAIEFVEDFARSQSLHSLTLDVDIANTRGQRFYQARGFHYYPHMHIMNKQLEVDK